MANQFEIPFVVPDASSALANLTNVFQKNRAAKQADEELRLRGEKLRNDERRLSSEEARKKLEFEQSQQDRRDKAFLSAMEFEKKGDYSTADAIRRAHGIESTPEMSGPTPYTPAMALEASRKNGFQPAPVTGDAVKFEQSEPRAPITPLNALSRRPGEHAGTTVPEMQPSGYTSGGMDAFGEPERQRAADNMNAVGSGLHGGAEQQPMVPPPDVTIEPPTAGRAVEDLIPMTEDSRPTGAKRFTGPGGVFLGRFDPEEQRQFRRQQADEASQLYGDIDQRFGALAATLVAQGVPPEKVGPIIATSMEHFSLAEQKAADKAEDREDRQSHQALLAKLYRNEALTVQDIYNLARIRASIALKASGGGPITPAEAALVKLAEQGAGLGEITAQASVAGPAVDMKHLAPLVQNVVGNAVKSERAQEKRSALEVNDLNGKSLGEAHSPAQATALFKLSQSYSQARMRLNELIHDIETNGARISGWSPEKLVNEIQERLSKAESVNASMRVFNGLGATDASQRLEARITGAIGTPGHGWLMGANLNVIKRMLHEADMRFDAGVKAGLKSGGGKPLAPALGGPRREGDDTSKEDRKRALMDRLGL